MEGREMQTGFRPAGEDGGKERMDAKAEYGNLTGLFEAEVNDDSLAGVEGQMAELHDLIERHRQPNDDLKRDPDVGPYVDEYAERIERAVTGFSVNGKKVNLRELSGKSEPAEIYDEAAYFLKEHKEMFLGGE